MLKRFDWLAGAGLAVAVFLVVVAVPSSRAAEELPHGATTINLCDLAVGETRSFGDGEQIITATREEDSVSLTLPAGEGEHKTMTLGLAGGESCPTLVHVEAPGHREFFVKHEGTVEGGEHKVREIKIKMVEGGREFLADEDARVMVICEKGEGLDPAACGGRKMIFISEDGEAVVNAGHGEEDLEWHIKQLHGHDDMVTLRCPEGDTTMRLKKDEAAAGYTCPKHFEPLEEVKEHKIIKRIRVVHEDEEEREE